jgi:hypothetical protein
LSLVARAALRSGSARTRYRAPGLLTLLFCPTVAAVASAPSPLTVGSKRRRGRQNTE